MGNAWFVRSKLDDANMIGWFKAHDIIATKVRGANQDVDQESSVNLSGKSVEEINDILSKEPYQLKEGSRGNTRLYLDLFVNQMKIGDLVLIPDGRTVHFARITGDYMHQSEVLWPIYRNAPKSPWLAHQRSVEWLETISRDDLSNKLRDTLKNQRLVGDLSKFYDEIEARSQDLPYEPKNNTIEVRYPLRPDFDITYTIPADMTAAEAEKVSAHFKTVFFRL